MFYLELDLSSSYSGSNPVLEILKDGVVVSSVSITSASQTASFFIENDADYPSSLSFRFSGSSGTPSDSISLSAVRISGQTVDSSNLSMLLLGQGNSSAVNITNTQYLFGKVPPTLGDVGGPTLSGTSGNDKLNSSIEGETIDGGDGNDTITGRANNDKIFGGNGSDNLSGAEGNDLINGGSGADTIYGNEGADLIYGDADNDRIFGGSGIDTINGGTGNDTVFGDDGIDIIFGDAGIDILYGDASNDYIYGGAGNDRLNGGLANDVINGGDDNDIIIGGFGNDTMIGGNGTDTVIFNGNWVDYAISYDAGSLTYTIIDRRAPGTSEGADTITGFETVRFYDQTITLGPSSNLLNDAPTDISSSASTVEALSLEGALVTTFSTTDPDTNDTFSYSLTGGEISGFEIVGNQLFISADGIDSYLPGDTISVEVTVIDASGGSYAETFLFLVTSATSINGTSGDDILIGTSAAETFFGFEGNDTIDGGSGNDQINGGPGADVLNGGAGNDTLRYDTDTIGVIVNLTTMTASGGDATGDTITSFENVRGGAGNDSITGNGSNNTIYGNAGNDTILGEGGNDNIFGGAGADVLDGGVGTDTLRYDTDTTGVNVNLATNTVSGGDAAGDTISGFENARGGSGNDTITGTTGNNTIYGNAGNDTINGGDGNDTIYGGAGADTMNGGNGTDTLNYSTDTAGVTINLATNTASGGDAAGDVISNFENVTGGAGSDTITGSTGNNTLRGGTGNDTVNGGDGNDNVFGDAGADTLDGGNGTDTVRYDNDTVGVIVNLTTMTASGGQADGDIISNFESVRSGSGIDTLTGNSAANTLNAGNGNDFLNGKDGNDTLTGGSGLDTFIFDSLVGSDTLTDYNTAQGDILDIADLLSGFTPGVSDIDDFARFTTSGANSLLQIDANGLTGGAAFVTIATINGVTGLSAQTLYDSGQILAV